MTTVSFCLKYDHSIVNNGYLRLPIGRISKDPIEYLIELVNDARYEKGSSRRIRAADGIIFNVRELETGRKSDNADEGEIAVTFPDLLPRDLSASRQARIRGIRCIYRDEEDQECKLESGISEQRPDIIEIVGLNTSPRGYVKIGTEMVVSTAKQDSVEKIEKGLNFVHADKRAFVRAMGGRCKTEASFFISNARDCLLGTANGDSWAIDPLEGGIIRRRVRRRPVKHSICCRENPTEDCCGYPDGNGGLAKGPYCCRIIVNKYCGCDVWYVGDIFDDLEQHMTLKDLWNSNMEEDDEWEMFKLSPKSFKIAESLETSLFDDMRKPKTVKLSSSRVTDGLAVDETVEIGDFKTTKNSISYFHLGVDLGKLK